MPYHKNEYKEIEKRVLQLDIIRFMQNCKNILIKNGKDNYFLFYSSEIGTLAMCKFIYSESMLFESLVHANTNSQYMIVCTRFLGYNDSDFMYKELSAQNRLGRL